MEKWYMTNDEIAVSYRQAKNKAEQVLVLAELNVKTRDETLDKLAEIGAISAAEAAYEKAKPKQRRAKRNTGQRTKPYPFDVGFAQGLLASGSSDAEIAAVVGASRSMIERWRRDHGFLRQRGGARKRKG